MVIGAGSECSRNLLLVMPRESTVQVIRATGVIQKIAISAL